MVVAYYDEDAPSAQPRCLLLQLGALHGSDGTHQGRGAINPYRGQPKGCDPLNGQFHDLVGRATREAKEPHHKPISRSDADCSHRRLLRRVVGEGKSGRLTFFAGGLAFFFDGARHGTYLLDKAIERVGQVLAHNGVVDELTLFWPLISPAFSKILRCLEIDGLDISDRWAISPAVRSAAERYARILRLGAEAMA